MAAGIIYQTVTTTTGETVELAFYVDDTVSPTQWTPATKMASGAVLSGAFSSGSIASGAVASGAIASGAVATGAFASGSIGSGAVASGAIASGAVASGAVASGAYASGSIASGAMVDLGAIGDAAVTAGATGSVNAKLRSISRDLVASIGNSSTGIAPVVSSSAESSHVIKASAGTLFDWHCTTGASNGYVMIFDATSAPADGAVTPKVCMVASSGATVGHTPSGPPTIFATGITMVFSTTGPFTKTASATAFFSAKAV